MMKTYPVGAVAEKVLAVRIGLAGEVTTIFRQRNGNGELVPNHTSELGTIHVPASFGLVVRMLPQHSGTLEILPGSRKSSSSHTIIPLGPDSPVLESELPPIAGAAGAGWKGTFVEFQFREGRLTWQASNIAGRVDLSEEVPLVTITLRLSPENDGEIILTPYLVLTSTLDSRHSGHVESSPLIRAKN